MMWYNDTFKPNGEDRFAHYTSASFDVSLEEIFAPLTSGAAVFVMPPTIALDPKKFIEKIQSHQITTFECVPSFLEQLLNYGLFTFNNCLRYIIVGSEALPIKLLKQYQSLTEIPLYNLYGPTETTINASYYDCRRLSANYKGSSVPIGQPIANTHLYILINSRRCCYGRSR